MRLVLASSSRYRKALLERLHLEFEVDVPNIDESRCAHESPTDLVRRLARDKARTVADRHDSALIVGSDQVAVLGDDVLGKPENFDKNVNQLSKLAGHKVRFLIGLCLINSETGHEQLEVVPFDVEFKPLTRDQIKSYVSREQPYDCAGGFRSEGLGIALFNSMSGDPTALVGLPLIALVKMLEFEGLDVLLQA